MADGQRRHGALAYGRLAHRLLEILPSVPTPMRGDVAGPIMRQYDDLTDVDKNDILQRVEAIIEMPEPALFTAKHLQRFQSTGVFTALAWRAN